VKTTTIGKETVEVKAAVNSNGVVRTVFIKRYCTIVLKIQCIFDPESGRSGLDPLGRLAISDDNSEIVVDPTYFDSWLAALIDAFQRIQTTNHVVVEVSEEPKPLQIDISANGQIVFSYEGREVGASGRKEFENALSAAANSFLNELKESPGVSQNRFIDPIRRFVVTTRN